LQLQVLHALRVFMLFLFQLLETIPPTGSRGHHTFQKPELEEHEETKDMKGSAGIIGSRGPD